MFISSSTNCSINDNSISYSGYGIIISRGNKYVLANNNLINNEYGIVLLDVESSAIIRNNITENSLEGLMLNANSIKNLIYHNRFIENTQYQAVDQHLYLSAIF